MSIIERIKDKIEAVFKDNNKNSKKNCNNRNDVISVSTSVPVREDHDSPHAVKMGPPSDRQSATPSLASELSSESGVLTTAQRAILEQITRSSTSAQRLVIRAQIILTYAQGLAKCQVAKKLKSDRKTVRKWCGRWGEVRDLSAKLESEEIPEKAYRAVIAEALNDASRSGAPVTFTAEQVTHIVALACEIQDGSDGAVSHQTTQHLADEAVKRGFVESVSRSSVGRFLREADLKPHLSRYQLNAPDKNTEEFTQEVRDVCNLYRKTPELHQKGAHVMSTDEKPGIQALERCHNTHPTCPDGIRTQELREYNYERHGTLCLIANFEVATGHIVAPTLGPTRTEKDFVRHIAQTVSRDPQGRWIFITDQLNTHQSESLVKWVAEQCGIKEELGIKGKKGVLTSMKTRKAFLSDLRHRIRFLYTPKHSSWLNQIEIWFSILVRRLLKRGSFFSLKNLKERILKFIDFFNQTMAKAFKWTCTGRPLTT